MTELDDTHRRAQLTIRAAALRDLLAVWPAFDLNRIAATWPTLQTALLQIVHTYGPMSAGVASRYYRTARTIAGAPGSATARIAELDDDEIIRGLVAVGPVNAARQLARNRRIEDVSRATVVNLSGETGRHVLNAGRATLTASLTADKAAKGVQRVTDRDPCRWCADQASRTYPPTERFPAHAHCACFPRPVF